MGKSDRRLHPTRAIWRIMKKVELYLKVRRAVMIDGMSRRGAATYFGINRTTVDKMLVFPKPPQHGRSGRSFSGKLTGLTEIIDKILADEGALQALLHGQRLAERLENGIKVRRSAR